MPQDSHPIQRENNTEHEAKKPVTKGGCAAIILIIILGAAFGYPVGISLLIIGILDKLIHNFNIDKAIYIPWTVGLLTLALFISLALVKTREKVNAIIIIIAILAMMNAGGCVMLLNGLSKIGR